MDEISEQEAAQLRVLEHRKEATHKLERNSFEYAKKETFDRELRVDENRFAIIRASLSKGWRDGFVEACKLLGVSVREAINVLEQQKGRSL